MASESESIFVVDDEDAVRETIVRQLERRGYAVHAFSSAVDALERLPALRPGVVVSDLHMPEMDGIEFLRQVRRLCGPEVPQFIVVTGFGDLASAREAVRQGAHEYLTKPFDPADLADAVRRASERTRLLLARASLLGIIVEDLRVPLGAVRMNLEAMAAGAAGPVTAEQADLLALCCGACDRMRRLAQNLEDLGLLERRELDLKREPVAVAALVERALRRAGRAPATASGPPVFALADAEVLTRALEGLFAAARGEPTVAVERKEAFVRVAVAPFDARLGAASAGVPSVDGRAAWEALGLDVAGGLAVSFAAAAAATLGGRLAFEPAAPDAAAAILSLEAAEAP
jgi:CheY-like chemotaxis protein